MKQLAFAVLITAVAFAPLASAQHISVGIVGGFPLSDGLSGSTFTNVDTVSHIFSDSHNYLVGPMVDIRLPLSLGIEVDALYHPVNVTTDLTVIPSTTTRTSSNPATWEFPVLGKYRLPLLPVIRPFIEAGPSFRTRNPSLSYLSSKGFSIGAGLEVKILRLRIAPALRYTHWGSDAQGQGIVCAGGCTVFPIARPASNQNQGEFLVGFSF